MRVDAMLSRYGYCSRREARAWVNGGRVVSGGVVIKNVNSKVEPADTLVDGEAVPFVDGLYVALHKPIGYTCSHDEEGDLVYDLLPAQWMRRGDGVNSVGRLDKETSGLLLLTDDGKFEHAMTSPRRHVAKVYEMTTESAIPQSAVALFASGELLLQGEKTPCLPAELEITGECSARLILHEGRYHQVRRMMASRGMTVLYLERRREGVLELGDLPRGQVRELAEAEIAALEG